MSNPGKYTKKPVTVEAFQYTGENYLELSVWTRGYITKADGDEGKYCRVLDTLHGSWITFGIGDWIIRGLKGEYYPVTETIFHDLYAEAE